MAEPETPRADVLALKERVQRLLIDQNGSVSIDRDGDFFIRQGSAVVYVRVMPWGDTSTLVKVWSILVTSVPLTPDVYRWVAVEGQCYWFGHARVVENDPVPGEPVTGGYNVGRIQFEHVLLGDVLDADELEAAVHGVWSAGDSLDDELVTRFGGTRFG